VLDTRQKVTRQHSRARAHEVLVDDVAAVDTRSDPRDSWVEALELIEAAARRRELHAVRTRTSITRERESPLRLPALARRSESLNCT
jgi:hypothetical protein